ncbi:hypothetical protein [Lacipirellula parvula]|uniref:Uncharacterized protein n=1 Tax=Lacipirellula parvula TaxID=2650471 RepID=A0A5K7XDT9_9BACT|nr:hypothetical protein [Lacipirellula parvula]BBO34940.1 hypothetical protein PLANPX_4552 [Lacipirellula parvula]
MTTVRCTTRPVEGKLRLAVLLALTLAAPAAAQEPVRHWTHAGAMPPGAIGRQRLMRGEPLSGYCQAVELRAPQGARVAPAAGAGFAEGHPDSLMVGLVVGPVYRFRVTDIPEHPGLEVFPTVEMVDRIYPPEGESLRFPVPVDLTLDELVMASEGKFVTRVIYVEDPDLAVPIAEKTPSETRWFDVRTGEDPLVAADELGRPIAILRIGGRVPEADQNDVNFVYGAAPAVVYDRANRGARPGVMLTPHEEQIVPVQ